MKSASILLICLPLFTACGNKAETVDNTTFKAEKITQTATITLNENIETTFPLFGAFEERKWSKGWNPVLIYPSTEIIEEGTTFKTHGHGHDEKEFIWRVSKYEKEHFLIQYLVSSENRYWTITVQCTPTADNKTSARITYAFIGLNELGNQLNKHFIQNIYKHNLNDWQEEINNTLGNRK